jgi:hypothetical protein
LTVAGRGGILRGVRLSHEETGYNFLQVKDPCKDWKEKLKRLLRAIANTLKNIAETEDFIANGKNGDKSGISINHWQKELRNFKKNLKDYNDAKKFLEDECGGK